MSPLPPRHLSRLESLPLEILESIFLHSLEINLPRASPHLARALSNPLLYTWLIRLAFSSANPGSRNGFFTPDFLPPPLNFWGLELGLRQHLQSTLLACRWCTLPFMRKCQREYVQHAIRRKCADLIFSTEDQDKLSELEPLFGRLEDCDQAVGGHRGKGDLVLHAQLPKNLKTDDQNKNTTQKSTRLENETQGPDSVQNTENTDPHPSRSSVHRKLAIWFHFGAVQIRKPNEIYYENDLFRLPSSISIAPGRIPDKVLRAPWSDEQFEFLQLLSTDFYLDADNDPTERSAEITTKLIRKRQIKPFVRLLDMSFRSEQHRVLAKWPVQNEHYHLVKTYANCLRERAQGPIEADPFAIALVDHRWDYIPADLKGDFLRLAKLVDSK